MGRLSGRLLLLGDQLGISQGTVPQPHSTAGGGPAPGGGGHHEPYHSGKCFLMNHLASLNQGSLSILGNFWGILWISDGWPPKTQLWVQGNSHNNAWIFMLALLLSSTWCTTAWASLTSRSRSSCSILQGLGGSGVKLGDFWQKGPGVKLGDLEQNWDLGNTVLEVKLWDLGLAGLGMKLGDLG